MRKAVICILFTLFVAGNNLKIFLPVKKGEYATLSVDHYREMAKWVAMFRIVEVGSSGDVPEEFLEDLRKKETNPIFYRWFPADYHYIYAGEDNALMRWIYANRSWTTLNPQGPFPHCEENGYDWCQDFYFDLGNSTVRKKVNEYIKNIVSTPSCAGVFFDWASGTFIEEEEYLPLLELFRRRHPHENYLRAVVETYRELRNSLKEKIIVTNQGFRNPDVLRWVDYDMTESYGTGCEYFGKVLNVEGRGLVEVPQTVYYPVSIDYFSGSLQDSIYYLDYLWKLLVKFKEGALKNFIYMNYAAPVFIETKPEVYRPYQPRNAIFYGYALAKLRNFVSYTEIPFLRKLEQTDLYFYDLGKPLGDSYYSIGGGYVRYYTNGFVIVGEWDGVEKIVLSSPYLLEGSPVYDLYEEKWIGQVKNGTVFITIAPARDELTGRMAPVGRVFFYPASRLFRNYH